MITADEQIDLDPIRDRLAAMGRAPAPADVAAAMHAEGLMVSDATLIETVEALRRNSVGAGPLDPLLHQPGVTDILVNGPDQVYVERGAGLELTGLADQVGGSSSAAFVKWADGRESALTRTRTSSPVLILAIAPCHCPATFRAAPPTSKAASISVWATALAWSLE